ncbi:MAG: alpha/beta hydrolase [Chloroflexi bacterium]|nr:alpha/beta hydrolase [Chloroflexota bacterium]
MYNVLESARTQEVAFAGDGVALAGQIDYPAVRPPADGYPLLFVLHHAGYDTREAYRHYIDVGHECGYAVFTWDKRGTGRSGACGRGSTTRDALNAYHAALSQPLINRARAIILAVGAGTTLLGAAFKQFAHVQRPAGVLLAGNMLDAQAILAVDAPLQIIVGAQDWTPWQLFGKAAAKAHNQMYTHGAAYYVADHADRALMDTRTDIFCHLAGDVIRAWLNQR